MKKIFFLIFSLSSAFIFCGCEDLLNKPSFGTQSNENYYKTEKQIQEALTGTYLRLRLLWNEYALNFYFTGDCTTDDALKGGANNGDRREVQEMSDFTMYPSNGEVYRRWSILFGVIERANDVIFYGPTAEGNQDLIKQYINEAKALRAFAYYSLVTTFGGVPLVTKPVTPSDAFKTGRATDSEIYELIISDLTDASQLPTKSQYSAENQYRVTSGFAKTMLAKTYMFRRDFVNAEKVLKEIIDSGEYRLFADYGFNWRVEYENGSESVFEIPNKCIGKNIDTGTNVPHFFTSRRISGYQGYGFHCPTADLLSEFDPDDPRITYIFTRTGDRYIGDTEEQDNFESPSTFHDYKMTVPRVEKTGFDVWMISYNIRMIRYADVLLLYAEALNENGKSSEALNYLNQVRKRARETNPVDPRKDKQAYVPPTTSNTLPNITVTNKDQLRPIIWSERRKELAMEGWRRDDLMRQKRFGEVMRAYAAKYNTTKGKNFDDARDYLLPIPQSDIDRTNDAITQNPGY